jgi:hypothetical protein
MNLSLIEFQVKANNNTYLSLFESDTNKVQDVHPVLRSETQEMSDEVKLYTTYKRGESEG